MKRVLVAVVLILAMVIPLLPQPAPAAAAGTFADPGMQSVWNRTDMPVEQLKASRTWMWGPSGFATKLEPYAETQGGQRTVEYFDKSRMEINNPNGDRGSQWFVTNGLLSKELVTGEMQVGDKEFETRYPAQIPVAGDPDDTNGPTYASFATLLDKQAHNPGEQLTDSVDRLGTIKQSGPPTGVTAAYYVPESKHTVASVFWDFFNSSGMVNVGGKDIQGKLFEPTFFATGFPITEAYWAQVKLAGQEKWVLVQVFERRVLTYTPDNPEGWKVEMGNVGRHYYDWRYNNAGMPAAPADLGADLPAAKDGSVSPTWGPAGTTFIMNMSGFQPNEQVGYWVNNADGAINGTSETEDIGPTGSYINLPISTYSGWDPGVYSVVFHGVTSGHESVVYFKIVTEDQMPIPGPRTLVPNGWTQFDDSANGYKIGIPSGWKAFKGNTPEMEQYLAELTQVNPTVAEAYRSAIANDRISLVAYDTSPEARGAGGEFTQLTVQRTENSTSFSVDDFASLLAYAVARGNLSVTPITQERIITADGDLIVLKFQMAGEGGASNMSDSLLVGTSGGYVYMVEMTTTAELEGKYAPLFDQLAHNFQPLPTQ